MMDSSIEDIFESSLKLEETHFKDGYDEGYADGIIPGKEEGRQVGLKTGFEVGEELGFYRGCVDVWTSAIRVDPNCFSARIQKTINKMDELLQGYPVWDPENESVSDTMDSLRLKFKIICATLNMKLAPSHAQKNLNEYEIYGHLIVGDENGDFIGLCRFEDFFSYFLPDFQDLYFRFKRLASLLRIASYYDSVSLDVVVNLVQVVKA